MGTNALIVVDIQNDFLQNGALGVPGANEVLPLINRLVKLPFDSCIATQDWHPQRHCSFASTWEKNIGEGILIEGIEQMLWPEHCVQGTKGAEFPSALDVTRFEHIVHKGIDPEADSYSTFFDNQRHRSTGLENYLRSKEIKDLYFAGLCTEYCVFYSVLDTIDLGFTPHVIIDACRGIDLAAGDVERAIRTMVEHGVELLTTEEVIQRIQ